MPDAVPDESAPDDAVQRSVDPAFSGVVSARRGDTIVLERAYGHADRAHRIAATPKTRFAIASGSKGFTALVVMALVDDGTLTLATTARSLLGDDLPLIDDRVTVRHLLAHRSGIGDYIDEESDEPDWPLRVPVHDLVTTEDFLAVLDGFPTKFAPDQRFSYCNGGFVVLALLAERAAGRPFHDLVAERVCRPAGMVDTAYLRSDQLPGAAAVGYLESGRTNVFHLPVVGNGDGGAYTTIADLCRFWRALFDGRIVPPARVAQMTSAVSVDTGFELDHGLGFWLADDGSFVSLRGGDHGVSFCSEYEPTTGLTRTVVANTEVAILPTMAALRSL